MLDPDNSSLGSFIQMRLRYLVDVGDWGGEVASWEIPPGTNVAPRLTSIFTKGYGAAQRGKKEDARAALQELRAVRSELEKYLKEQNSSDLSYSQRAEILEVQLQAMILSAEGEADDAVTLLRNAAKTEESMPIAFGPPFVDKPTYELLGEFLLKLNRPQEARVAFEAALARTPLRTGSLLGLARAAAQSGDKLKAKETYAKLRQIWKQAEETVRDNLPHEE
jgi:tetratricopeptide (TPR) repeat protein